MECQYSCAKGDSDLVKSLLIMSFRKMSQRVCITKFFPNLTSSISIFQVLTHLYTKLNHVDYDKWTLAVDKKRSTSIKRSDSRGRAEGRSDRLSSNNTQKGTREPGPTNEGDRLYKEILEKLTKERTLKAQ